MSVLESKSDTRLIRTYGRLKGRPLSRNQKIGLAMLFEKYNVGIEEEKKKCWLEIGFGDGQHIVELARKNTEKIIIGSEVYENGVATACFSLFKNNIKNVKVFYGDVRLLLGSLKRQSIERLYILFPDP